MIRAIVFDFCRVLIFPRDENYYGQLNSLHDVLSENRDYNFSDNFVFNQELMDFINDKGLVLKYDLYLITSGKILDEPECQRFLNNTFKGVFNTKTLKTKKNDPSTYSAVAKKLGITPLEILLVDNNRENTEAAETAGFLSITFRNNMQFETEIEGYL